MIHGREEVITVHRSLIFIMDLNIRASNETEMKRKFLTTIYPWLVYMHAGSSELALTCSQRLANGHRPLHAYDSLSLVRD